MVGSYTEHVYRIIQQLVPSVSGCVISNHFQKICCVQGNETHFVFFLLLQSYYLPMSLQNMNQMRLVPKKDYVGNRLLSGTLQLAKNTLLFLDETKLEQGQLDSTGESLSLTLRVPAAAPSHQHLLLLWTL